MNRNVNEGYAINKQKDTLPLLGFINENLEGNKEKTGILEIIKIN